MALGADAQVQDLAGGKDLDKALVEDLDVDLAVALAEDLDADLVVALAEDLDAALVETGDVLELDRAEVVQKVVVFRRQNCLEDQRVVFDQPNLVMTPKLGPKL